MMASDTGLAESILDGYRRETEDVEAQVRRLIDQRAGLASDPTGQDGRCRMRQPRLITTAPIQRKTALRKKMLEYGDTIASVLPELIAAAIKLKMAENEIAAIDERDREKSADRQQYRQQHLFPHASRAVERLYDTYKVTHWHWANVSKEQLTAIAAILHRKGATEDAA